MDNERAIPPASDDDNYPMLRAQNDNEMSDLQGNLGPEGISFRDLPAIKAPSGGAQAFLEQTLDGEKSRKEIKGIIGATKYGRQFWNKTINEGGGRKRPDCVSHDGLVGEGDPGGNCANCPYSKFGSAPNGHGQACQASRPMVIFQPGANLPNRLNVPATSLKNWKSFVIMLLASKLQPCDVVTNLTLEKATNEDHQDYAKIAFNMDRILGGPAREAMKGVQAKMKALLDRDAFESGPDTIDE